MRHSEPPLPPALLRQTWRPPFEDDAFRNAAVDEVMWLQERGGLTPDSSVLEIGCGPGRLAAGLRLHLGNVRCYTGIAVDAGHLEWCREHLGGAGFEFVAHRSDERSEPTTVSEINLEVDRIYDLIYVRLPLPFARPIDISSLLRSLRHHVADTGTILVEVGMGDHDVRRLDELARHAGLVVVSLHQEGTDGRRVLELTSGLGDGALRPFGSCVESAWRERTVMGLNARFRALATEHRQFTEIADERIETLALKLDQRDLLVVELRTRLRRCRSKIRRQAAAIERLERDLVDARRSLPKRLMRALSRRGRPTGVSAPAPAPATAAEVDPREETPSDGASAEAEVLEVHPSGFDQRSAGDRGGNSDPLSDLVVYTASVSDFEHLADVTPYETLPVRFVCFCDMPPSDPMGWEILPAAYFNADPRRVDLFYKTHPHLFFSEQAISAWVDPSFRWTGRFLEMLAQAATVDAPVGALRRDDVTLESLAEEVVQQGFDSVPLVRAQVDRYLLTGFPGDLRLHDPAVLLRRHSAAPVLAMDEAWWEEIERGSRSDRLSFEYTAWSHGVEVDTIPAVFLGDEREAGLAGVRSSTAHRYRRPRSTSEAARHRMAWTIRDAPSPSASPSPSTPSRSDDPVDVVVPVHDALPYVQRCVRSVIEDPAFSGRLIIVDDGSKRATREWCAAFADGRLNVEVVVNDEPLGFSAASNIGIARSSTECFALLNSDAVVSSGWLVKLLGRLRSHPGVGLIGPLSNAASWQSIPTIRDVEGNLAVNGLPPGCSLEEVNRFLEMLCDGVITPLVGTLNGFCLMVRREVVDEVGSFDDAAFPRGYGEEVDLTLRAGRAGFLCAVAPDTYVYHAKSKSFGDVRRAELKAAGQAVLRDRYGVERLDRVAVSVRNHPALEFVRSAFAELYVPEAGPVDIVGIRATT